MLFLYAILQKQIITSFKDTANILNICGILSQFFKGFIINY